MNENTTCRGLELFSQRLKIWRLQADFPLKRVAYDLGVSTATVCAWEQGLRFPSMQHLAKISEYTGIPLCAFFNSCDDSQCRFVPRADMDGCPGPDGSPTS